MSKVNSMLENKLRELVKDERYYAVLTELFPAMMRTMPSGLNYKPGREGVIEFHNRLAELNDVVRDIDVSWGGMPNEDEAFVKLATVDAMVVVVYTPAGIRKYLHQWRDICKALELPSESDVWRARQPNDVDMRAVWLEFQEAVIEYLREVTV
ncbi:hypothetical protein [Pseudomonas aeruginosa]|uniref:hypothetical protein n=1 Tax=Pseudomonas aeruginosa TaxID=287 RepID=UPI001CA5079D|nr:hypothetical protein [Pseudomonas aeruginosa]MBW6069687.1 hypothetical protein [Pseudomonas aeruginosa]